MPLITYDITVLIEDSDGDPVEGAIVTARLTKTDTDQAEDIFVAKETYRQETDENGQAVFSLWPNTRGTTGSQYRFKAYGPGGQIFNVLATVREQNDNLEDISSAAAPQTRFPVQSVQGMTGDVVLDPDDFDDSGTTNKFTTQAEISKLAGIEAAADVTDAENVGAAIHGATEKTTPVDTDTFAGIDNAASSVLKKFTWANIKAALLTYFTTLFTRRINSVQNLRDSNITTDTYVQCHTAEGDGGHGFFRYVFGAAPGTYTDNNGTVIVPTGGNGSAAWLREYSGEIDITWFGAVNYGETDNTEAIQAAINAAASAGGGVISIPPGSYVSGPVYITNSGIHIKGAGKRATTIKLKNSPLADQFGVFSFGIQSNKTTQVAITDCSITDLTINGNKSNQFQGTSASNGVNAGVFVYTVSDMRVENVKVYDCDGYGMGFVGTDAAGRSDYRVLNVETTGNLYDGIDFKGGTTNKPVRIWADSIYSHDNGPGVISGREAVGVDFRGQYIFASRIYTSGNANGGVRLRDVHCFEAVLDDCWAVGNTTFGFRLDGTADALFYRFNACGALNNTGDGFRVERGPVELVGCYSKGNVNGLHNNANVAFIRVNGGDYTGNTQDGMLIGVDSALVVNGAGIHSNSRHGLLFRGDRLAIDNSYIYNNSQASAGTNRGIVIDNVNANMSFWSIRGSQIYDNQGTKTQGHAIAFSNSPPAGHLIDNDLSGNLTAAITGTAPSGTLRRNNKGYKTQGTFESPAFAIDSTGVKTVSTTHNLDVTPASKDVQMTLIRSANNVSSIYDYVRVTGTTSNSVGAQVQVGTASATGGDTATLAVAIDSSIAP
jgi:hypothetical protein